MNILSWFTAGPEAASKVLDASISGIDKLVYTDQEKAVAKQKLCDQWIELQKLQGEETSIRGMTRRLITFLAFVPYVLLVLTGSVMIFINEKTAQMLFDVADGKFGWIVISVISFYFGPYFIGKALQGSK